jgi:ABC-type bacteriocin/lantibiotic exporter with double-glycine peptidase domain
MKYHGQFLLNVVLAIGLSGLCLIMLLTPYSKLSVHRYALSIFAYFSLGYYMQRLLFDGMLEIIVSKIKLENTKNNKKQIEMVKSPTAVETIADISKGVSVSFKEIVCKIAMKNVLEIRKVHCRYAEVLGVRGKGATCVVPMIYRILNPESGATFLAEHDLQQFDDTQLKSLVGVVLSDPYVPKVSVQ